MRGCRGLAARCAWARPRPTSMTRWRSTRPALKSWSRCASWDAAAYQRGEHTFGARSHAAPQFKRLRSLFHQHAPALRRMLTALFLGPLLERGSSPGVGHVVAEGFRIDDACRDGWQFTGEAGGGGVDDQIEGAARDGGEFAALHRTQRGELFRKGRRAIRRATGDDHQIRV